MIYINKCITEKFPKKTIIFFSSDYKNIIVNTPETDAEKIKKQIELFIIQEYGKAKAKEAIYKTILQTLTELKQ